MVKLLPYYCLCTSYCVVVYGGPPVCLRLFKVSSARLKLTEIALERPKLP